MTKEANTEIVAQPKGRTNAQIDELTTSILSVLENDTIHSVDLFEEDGSLNVLKTFLALTRTTCPLSDVTYHKGLLSEFGFGMEKNGNMMGYMKDGKASLTNPTGLKTVFMSHLDDASRGKVEPIQHVLHYDDKADKLWIKTDGKTLLGADDKAGVAIMLKLWTEKVDGLYYFFLGEESGGVGSRAAIRSYNFRSYERAVSFDRHSEGSVITHQGGVGGCSDAFADALIADLKKQGLEFKKDQGGTFTDSKVFFDQIPECINLSVGYEGYHGKQERQDADYLVAVAEAYAKVNWSALPTDFTLLTGKRPSRSFATNTSTYQSTFKRTKLDDVYDAREKGMLTVDLISSYLRDNPTEGSKEFYKMFTGKEWVPYDIDGIAVLVGDVVDQADSATKYEVTRMSDYSIFLTPLGTVGSISVGVAHWRSRGYRFVMSQVLDGTADNVPEVDEDEEKERLYAQYREY